MDDEDDKIVHMARKLALNVVGHKLHTPMQQDELLEILNEQGNNWETVWESIPCHAMFDQLYMKSSLHQAFLYDGVIYTRKRDVDDIRESYTWDTDTDVLEWMIENPPFEFCVSVADLYTYSQGIGEDKQPIILFALIIGLAEPAEDTDLTELLGVGLEDATYLGRALEDWGSHADFVMPYTTLILEHSTQEREI